jgi:long-chain acyl-CoA synthetase
MPDTLQLKPGVHAATDPGRAAVVEHESGRVVTYGDLEDRSSRLAGRWWSRGLQPGDHVAVMLDNQASYFEVAWAAQRSGLYLTPVNWHLGTEEAAYVIADCEARALVTTTRFAPMIDQLGDALARVEVRLVADGEVEGWDRLETVVAAAPPLGAADEVEGAWMFYSSGTTAAPRASCPRCPWRRTAPAAASTPWWARCSGSGRA